MLVRSALCLIAAASLASAGCGKKPVASGPPPELTGLAVVPASAEVVVGIDPAKLAGAPVIDRATEQLLMRDAALAERWQKLRDECKIDLVKQVKRIMLALGPPARPVAAGPAPGTGPVLMVVVGALPEADLQQCVAKLVGGGGGTVTGTSSAGRTLYLAKDGNRAMYFAYSRPDTIVLGSDQAFVTEALGTGKKATDNPELAGWLKLVNQNSPIWAVGRVDARVRDGLVELSEGKIGAGPVAIALTANLDDGADVRMSAVMSDANQAKTLESYVKSLLGLATAAAQLKSLGGVVGKITVGVEGNLVQFRAPLTVADLNQLQAALDGAPPPAQDRAPPQPSTGSGAK
ncbi:MAG TPA: hypothetical protein VK607_24965 [Kofleriaceae bacterium]|nr:hypothetical protein [Kofleriaceae bacterium]